MPLNHNILKTIEESNSLNPNLFSLTRILIMLNLTDLGEDGSTYRELKAVLQLNDGVLHSNLKALESMGYVKSNDVKIEEKNLKSYNITEDGKYAWENARKWLKKVLDCGGMVDE